MTLNDIVFNVDGDNIHVRIPRLFFLLFLSLYLVVKYASRICYLWPIAFGGEKSAVRALAHFYCVAESVFESTEAQVD